MGNDRLSDLLVIAVKSDIATKISLDDSVDVFSKMKIEDIHLQAVTARGGEQ
jgi:hypothetical protein